MVAGDLYGMCVRVGSGTALELGRTGELVERTDWGVDGKRVAGSRTHGEQG